MHELAVCQALLAQVEVIARQHAATVQRVRVSVGPLSGVEPELLGRAYEVASTGTAAQGSDLAIEQAPVRVVCRDCGAESATKANRLLCAKCGSWRTGLTSGDELLLLDVVLRKDPHPVSLAN